MFTCDFKLGTVTGFGNRRRKEEGKPLWGRDFKGPQAFPVALCDTAIHKKKKPRLGPERRWGTWGRANCPHPAQMRPANSQVTLWLVRINDHCF